MKCITEVGQLSDHVVPGSLVCASVLQQQLFISVMVKKKNL